MVAFATLNDRTVWISQTSGFLQFSIRINKAGPYRANSRIFQKIFS